jgi:radical SAM protein with 4Fe4S-binding SPASM domain
MLKFSTFMIEIDTAVYREGIKTGEAYKDIGPNNVILQINYACYLRCQMCNRHEWVDQGAPTASEFSTSELDILFNQLATLGTKKVTLVGTEPVMRPELPAVLKDLNSSGIKVELYTAGVVLKQDIIDAILDNQADVAFSLDGFSPETHNKIRMPGYNFDAYSKTMESIQRLREERQKRGLTAVTTKITTNFTVQKDNIDELEAVGERQIDAIGADVLRLSLVHGQGDYSLDAGSVTKIKAVVEKIKDFKTNTSIGISSGMLYVANGEISSESFADGDLVPGSLLTKRVRCHIGNYSTMIDPQGNVRPCLYLYDDNGPFEGSSRDQFVMGNLRNQSFAEIWNGQNYRQFRQEFKFPDFSEGSRCRTCEYMGDFERIDTALETGTPQRLKIGW